MTVNKRLMKGWQLSFTMLIFICTIIPSSYAQNSSIRGQFLLKDGVVVDQNRDAIYISNKESMVQGLDALTGKSKWKSRVKGRPLFISGNRLFVQVRKDKPVSELEIVELNLDRDAVVEGETTLQLPKTVSNVFMESPEGAFYINLYMVKEDVILEWAYRHYIGGAYMDENERQKEKGYFYFDGSFNPVKFSDLPKNFKKNPISPSRKDGIVEASGQQFFSADKKHILVSSFVSKPGVEKNYRWIIYDRNTIKMIGKYRNNVSFTPFIVRNSTLIFKKPFYEVFNKREVKKSPLQLVWYHLQRQRVLFNIEIFDTEYRGLTPP